jgi:hypothetical protein
MPRRKSYICFAEAKTLAIKNTSFIRKHDKGGYFLINGKNNKINEIMYNNIKQYIKRK